MKICVFSTHFGGGYGTGHSIKKEVDELISRGHKVTVVHGEKNVTPFISPKAKYFLFEYSKIPILGIFILQRRISRIVSRVVNEGIDVFYVQTLEFGLINKKIIADSKMVYFARSTVRGVEQNKPKEYWLDAIRRALIVPILVFLEKRCFKISKTVVVKSERMKQEVSKLYSVPIDKIRVLRGGVDADDFKKNRQANSEDIKERLGIKKNEKVILFAGRIVPVKGLSYLLEAFGKLVAEKSSMKLVIAGRQFMSHYGKVIEKIVKRFNLDNKIVFAGYVPQEKMYQYYNICDIVVAPSTYEPFGMVNIQAVAENKPLITTNIAGSLEVIKDYPNLKIVNPFSAPEIRDALIEVFTQNKKIQAYDSYKILQSISWTNMVDNLERAFEY